MSIQKSILLLGGSRQQVIAIKKAKELGYRTILCDYLPDNPGQHIADVFYQESTTDRNKVLQIARKEGVSGVLAYSSDPASLTAGYVAEQLDLPTNPLSSIEILSIKHLFRDFLLQNGFSCPRVYPFEYSTSFNDIRETLCNMRFPIIVKPTDSSGSKGVSILECIEGFELALEHAHKYSRNKVLIAEEFISSKFPHVIGGDIFVVNGIVRFWGLMSCLRSKKGNGLVPVGKKTPSGLTPNQLIRIKAETQRLVNELGISFGELNIEIIVGEDNSVNFLELGSRAGGNMIPVGLSDASGIDLVRANILCAMGEDPGDVDWEDDGLGECYCTYVLHSNELGIFEGISVSKELRPHLYRQVLYLEKGDKVEPFDGANKALGIMFFKFDDALQMNWLVDNISSHVGVALRGEK